jgi:glycosyltransferase involved in cell wall biosynthesis
VRVALVNTAHPFVRGGAEILVDALARKLNEFGHRAHVVRIPHAWAGSDAIERGMLAASLLRIPSVDRVIGHKFPSYYVAHEDKVVWLFHQFRQVYDLWQHPEGYGAEPEHVDLRRRIRTLDIRSLRAARRYALSEISRDRLRRFNGLDAAVLHHPLPDDSGFYCERYGDYIFCPSRISVMKRQHLLVRALQQTRTPVRLHLAGLVHGDEGSADALLALASTLGVRDRLILEPTFISERRKQELFAGALATAYVPLDEDSYGFVTLESFASQKPVVTSADSGGVLTIVRDGVSGFVTDPTPAPLAAAMDRLYDDRALAQRLGEGGAALVAALDISWHTVIDALTA